MRRTILLYLDTQNPTHTAQSQTGIYTIKINLSLHIEKKRQERKVLLTQSFKCILFYLVKFI